MPAFISAMWFSSTHAIRVFVSLPWPNPMKSINPSTALKHIYHAVYLQWFIGASLAFVVPVIPHEGETVFGVTPGCGGMLIFMGINVYCYIRRYEKALTAHTSNAPNVA